MYAMRAIGVELVAMFEDKNIKPKRLRELVTLLTKKANALPQHFEYAPNPKNITQSLLSKQPSGPRQLILRQR